MTIRFAFSGADLGFSFVAGAVFILFVVAPLCRGEIFGGTATERRGYNENARSSLDHDNGR